MYEKASALVQYADGLAQSRFGNWATSQAVFVGLVSTGILGLPLTAVIAVAAVGVLMCVAWWLTGRPIAKKIHRTNEFIAREYPNSAHAAYLNAFEHAPPTGRKRPFYEGPTRKMAWLLPLAFGLVWIILVLTRVLLPPQPPTPSGLGVL